MRTRGLLLIALMGCSQPPTSTADPLVPRGISLALAESRLRSISDVRYELAFDLRALAPKVPGRAKVAFELRSSGPVVLDFAGDDLVVESVNGAPPASPPRRVEDHWVLALGAGRNELVFRFTAPLAPAGAPLIRYHDAAANQDFVYTLLVPSDAHRMFPCFDQPSLRGRFKVDLQLPPGWTSVANVDSGFTEPLPTYLFAFAAGPFARVEAEGMPRVFVRPSRKKELEPAVARMNGAALRWFARWFGVPYAFPKLDVVLLPAFPYGGMEHAGAIFYRENALLFDHAPTPAELHRRSTLIYHEVAHQWFGNLVTMRWFDDLWLKEGFATFTAYRALAELEPGSASWLRFLQVVKPPAYAVDGTPGTTPIWQELDNLDDAKSSYGPIVYNKAPAVLRELEARLGAERFRAGVERFLARHALGSATWDDLVRALATASGQDLQRWSERWILAPGMPCVRVEWQAAAGKVRTFIVRQQGARGEPATWPVHVELLVGLPGGHRRELALDLDADSAEVAQLVGEQEPEFVVANARDVAYGRFLLDAQSASFWLRHLHEETDPLLRSVVRQQLADGVRECEIDPKDLVACLLRVLDAESDPATHAILLDSLGTMLLRYMSSDRRAAQLSELVTKGLAILAGTEEPKKLATLRFLMRASGDARVLDLCEKVACGEVPLARGLEDRFLAGAALLAAARPSPRATLALAELSADDARRLRFLAGAADPDPKTKQRYFAEYGNADSPPEQWVQDSLPFFHWRGQQDQTLPFLRPALERVEWVKQNRKIFFLAAWIDAFVNAHSSPEALAVVDGFVRERGQGMTPDIARKLAQSRDGLARAVAIRARWN